MIRLNECDNPGSDNVSRQSQNIAIPQGVDYPGMSEWPTTGRNGIIIPGWIGLLAVTPIRRN